MKQGNQTIAKYEARFIELAWFAPHMGDTDYKKARKFESGLRNAILDKVNVLKLLEYVDVLDRALMSTTNLASHSRPFEWKGKRQGSYSNKGSLSSKKQNLRTSSASNSTRDYAPTCN